MTDPFSLKTPESEANKRDMQAALGSAISRWAHVEGNLALLFTRVVTARRTESAMAVFEAIQSYEVQLAVTNAALTATHRSQPEILKTWKGISRSYRNLKAQRNKLAHGQIVQRFTGTTHTTDFIPFHHMMTHRAIQSFPKMTTRDLIALEKSFYGLAPKLWDFAMEVMMDEKQP